MPWPDDLGVVDTMIGFPDDPSRLYAGIRRSLRDRESLELGWTWDDILQLKVDGVVT